MEILIMDSEDSQGRRTPPEMLEAERETASNLLPEKSSKRYQFVYNDFMNWKTLHQKDSFSENVLLDYFNEQAQKYKSSSLWSRYSMLRLTLNLNHNINIELYHKLRAFLKQQSENYTAKKSESLSAEQVDKFIKEAPDIIHLATKVALIIGVTGGCRKTELYAINKQDVQDLGTSLLVIIPNIQTKTVHTFKIINEHYEICKKYMNLRPPDCNISAFFLNYQQGKCTKQRIGINKFSNMGKQIAKFLNLPNPAMYTGHCFRRSSNFKRNRGRKSTSMAESYFNQSLDNAVEQNLMTNYEEDPMTSTNEDDEKKATKVEPELLARTSTERSREYRMRQKAAKSDSLDNQVKGLAKTSAERTREFRLRQKAMKDGLPVPRRVKSGVVRARENRVRKAAERKAYELGELGDEADVEDWLTILNNKRAHQANRMREYRARKKAERLGLVYPKRQIKKEIKRESPRFTNTKYNPSEHSNSESRWENSEDSIGSYGDPLDYSDDESSAIDPEILIGLVKEHDILYNTKNSSYRDNSKKEAIWQLISQKLEQPKMPFSEISSEDCRMQWNSLRDRYRKHLRKRKLGLLSVPNKKWKYEDKISFIAPFFKDSALAESNTEEDSHLETPWENVQVKLEPSESEMEFEDETLQLIPNVEVKIEATSPLHATENDFTDDKIQPQDEIELFFYSLAQTVKKFPPYYRSIAKADICAAISKIELNILSNPDPTQES